MASWTAEYGPQGKGEEESLFWQKQCIVVAAIPMQPVPCSRPFGAAHSSPSARGGGGEATFGSASIWLFQTDGLWSWALRRALMGLRRWLRVTWRSANYSDRRVKAGQCGRSGPQGQRVAGGGRLRTRDRGSSGAPLWPTCSFA